MCGAHRHPSFACGDLAGHLAQLLCSSLHCSWPASMGAMPLAEDSLNDILQLPFACRSFLFAQTVLCWLSALSSLLVSLSQWTSWQDFKAPLRDLTQARLGCKR